MHNKLARYYESTTIRHYVRVVAFVVLGLSVVLLLYAMFFGVRAPVAPLTDVGSRVESTGALPLPRSAPTRLVIPALGIDVSFEGPLGLHADQTVEVPESFEMVGWYENGPIPGELGPAVILGHVDSKAGPAVFYSLGQLVPGDTIEVLREDGTTAKFKVTGLERYEQEGFPTELVYGNLTYPGLRLVTCSGVYDREEKRYSHNLVVYAALTED